MSLVSTRSPVHVLHSGPFAEMQKNPGDWIVYHYKDANISIEEILPATPFCGTNNFPSYYTEFSA